MLEKFSSVHFFKTEGIVYSFSISSFVQGSGEIFHDILQYVFRNLCELFIDFMSSVAWATYTKSGFLGIFVRSNIMPVHLGNKMAMACLQSGR